MPHYRMKKNKKNAQGDMMKHTYLFSEGKWTAEGKYFDKNEVCWKLSGMTAVTYRQDFWKLEGYIDVFFTETAQFENSYKALYRQGDNVIPWESFNTTFGSLKGKFTVSDDCITSNYASDDGKVTGWEVLIQINADKYKNVGVFFVNCKKLASWLVTFKKIS